MKLLNVGCGPIRPQCPLWTNLDNLRTQLPPGSGARANLDAEANYVEHDLSGYQMPFGDGMFDGILMAHCLEHFPAQKGAALMEDCRRMLRPGGVLLISVPDATYFKEVYPEDENANWPRLFDTTDPRNPIPTFFQAALWFSQHDVILTQDALWCYFVRAGFSPENIWRPSYEDRAHAALNEMMGQLDRVKFSLIMASRK